MYRPLKARWLNQKFRDLRKDTPKLSPDIVDYTASVVGELHGALINQSEPPYHRPEHPINGWGLTATPYEEHGEFAGVPIVNYLGQRAIYLGMRADVMRRVLSTTHPFKFQDQVIQIRRTNVPDLLDEDPTLFYGLLDGVDQSINEFNLDYVRPPLPISLEDL